MLEQNSGNNNKIETLPNKEIQQQQNRQTNQIPQNVFQGVIFSKKKKENQSERKFPRFATQQNFYSKNSENQNKKFRLSVSSCLSDESETNQHTQIQDQSEVNQNKNKKFRLQVSSNSSDESETNQHTQIQDQSEVNQNKNTQNQSNKVKSNKKIQIQGQSFIDKNNQIQNLSKNCDTCQDIEIKSQSQVDQQSQIQNSPVTIKFNLIFTLIHDQSSEQQFKKIKLFEENLQNLKNQSKEQKYDILGFYGQEQQIIRQVKDWMNVEVEYEKDPRSKFQIFIGIYKNKIAVFLLTDEKIYEQFYQKGFEIIDFIKIIQDLSLQVNICVDQNFYIDQNSKNPRKQKKGPQKIQGIQKQQQFQLQIDQLEDKNQLLLENLDQCYIWNEYLIRFKINYLKKNETQYIYVQDYLENCLVSLRQQKMKKIQLNDYLQYIQKNIKRIIENKSLQQIFEETQDQVICFIGDEQEKELFKNQMKTLLQQYLDQESNIQQNSQAQSSNQKNQDQEENEFDVPEYINKENTNFESLEINYLQQMIDLIKKTNLNTQKEQIEKIEIKMDFFKFAFPQDMQGNISSFQINDIQKSHEIYLNYEEKKIEIEKIISVNQHEGKIIINQEDDQNCIIVNFCLKNNNMQIANSYKLSKDTKIYIDKQNKREIFLNNDKNKLEISSIQENFKHKSEKIMININNQQVKHQGNTYDIIQIKDFIYKHDQKKIYIINQDCEIFTTSICQNKPLYKLIQIQYQDSTTQQIKQKNFLSQNQESYQQFINCPNSSYIILKSKNNIDIYDISYKFLFNIAIRQNYIDSQIIHCNNKSYFVIQNTDCFECYAFKDSNNVQQVEHKSLGQKQEQEKGNTIIDYFYDAIVKYGSNKPYQENIIEKKILICDKTTKHKLENYTQKLRDFSNLINFVEQKQDIEHYDIQKFMFILQTRAPLHIASIEQQQLFPLKNGVNNRNAMQESLKKFFISKQGQEIYFHEQIKIVLDQIQFGIYEKMLQQEQKFDNIKVICTMGRQSLGKSYLLNRLFGTRFNVDPRRCTDGLWISMSAEILDNEHILYIIVDCEGLFNLRRVLEEELQLVSVCAGISNLTIFNSANNYDRKLEQFFGQLGKLSQKFKGQNYYNGSLFFLIRDVSARDKDAVTDSFSNDIQEKLIKDQNIQKKAFNDIFYDAISNFENKQDFDEDVQTIKELIIQQQVQNNNLDAKEFLQSLKLLLAKIYFNDDQDIDEAMMNMKIDKYYQESNEIFVKGNDHINQNKTVIKLENLPIEDIEITQKDIQFVLKDQETKNIFEDSKNPLNSKIHQAFIFLYNEKIKYDISINNEWIKGYNKFCLQIIKERIQLTVQYFELQFKDEERNNKLQDKINQLRNELEKILQQYSICQYKNQKCNFCEKICVQKKNHKGICNCFTDHLCRELCQIEDCRNQGFLCGKQYGHKDSKHYCAQSDHYCKEKCSKEGCHNKCKERCNHKSKQHDCQQRHICQKECSLESCKEKCAKVQEENHVHQCQNDYCPFKCILCDVNCMFPDHFHQNHIKNKDREKLTQDINDISYKIDHHNCGKDHICQEKCQQDGICECNYINIDKEVQSNNNKQFKYEYLQQNEKKNKCRINIPLFKKKHTNKHDCQKESNHRCNNQCPECKVYCELDIGHEKEHQNVMHKNKDNTTYCSTNKETKITKEKDGEQFIFNQGENAEIEKCLSSCIEKGRSHVHLIECPGGENCYEKKQGKQKARHIEQQLIQNSDKQYDQFLCQNFFKHFNWKPPAYGEEQEIINLCSIACQHNEHKKKNEVKYCSLQAWHEGPHQLGHTHKNIVEKVQVAFVIDCTQSMKVYIDGTKTCIKDIMKNFKDQYKNVGGIEFGVVGYKDHCQSDGWDEKYPIKKQNFTDENKCLNFVNTLEEGGGHDPPEALIDGLQGSLELNWIEDSLKFLFVITDAPPHGKIFGTLNVDLYPNGCPCERNIDDQLSEFNDKEIRFRLVKINEQLNLFEQYVRQRLKNYETLELNSKIELEQLVMESLFKDLKNEYFELKKD